MRTDTARTAQKRPVRRPARRTDAVALLKKDHANVLAMFKKFDGMTEGGGGSAKAALVKKICEELTVHTAVEEEIFYPAVRAAIDEELLMDEAEVEHKSAKDLIGELEGMQPGDHMYDAKVTVLGEFIKHHVKEEHEEMFPKAKKAKVDMAALGEQMAERKKELAASPAKAQ